MRLFLLVLALTCVTAQNKERAKMVDEINNTPDATWTATLHPRFSHLPPGASKPMLGVKPNNKEKLRAAIAAGTVKQVNFSLPAEQIPESFDAASNPKWSKCAKVIGEIRDQSNCGCCWAFGAAEAASDRLCIATNGTVALPLSTQDLCFCGSNDGCGGGFLPDAWQYIADNGIVTGGEQGHGPFDAMGLCSDFTLPYCHHHGPQRNDPYPDEGKVGCMSQTSPSCKRECDSNAVAPHSNFTADAYTFDGDVVTYQSVAAIQTAIMTNGPVEAAFSVYSDFENYAGGIYRHITGEQLGGHAIKIVGWGKENTTTYWKVANSWNPYWGENGYFRIVRGIDNCGIEDQAVSSSAGSIWSGGALPPPPGPPDKCTAAMRSACGDAKSAGPSICRGCCDAHDGELSAAGCTEADEEKWCETSRM